MDKILGWKDDDWTEWNAGGHSVGRAIFSIFLLAVAVDANNRLMIGYVNVRPPCHSSNIIITYMVYPRLEQRKV